MPPYEGVPADESPCIVPGLHPECGQIFDFRRLGLRTTSMLISPWVAKGTVFQEPQAGPSPTSQFELTLGWGLFDAYVEGSCTLTITDDHGRCLLTA